MTTPPVHPRHRTDTPFTCQRCNGPCRTWKGAKHQWTCERCIRRYLDRQIARLDRGTQCHARGGGSQSLAAEGR